MSLVGTTLGQGRFVLETWIAGGAVTDTFIGRDRHSGRTVHVGTICSSRLSVDEMRDRLSYDVPGVAKCLFIGRADEAEPDSKRMFVVEEMPEGQSLYVLERWPSSAGCLSIAKQVAAIIAAAAGEGVVLAGIEPLLVYLDRDLNVGMVPRSSVLGGTLSPRVMYDNFLPPPYGEVLFVDPDMPFLLNATTASDIYCWGLITSWLFEHKHPFREATIREDDWHFAMKEGVREPFTGPAAIGKILDRVLLVDPAKRMSIGEVIEALDAVRLDDEP